MKPKLIVEIRKRRFFEIGFLNSPKHFVVDLELLPVASLLLLLMVMWLWWREHGSASATLRVFFDRHWQSNESSLVTAGTRNIYKYMRVFLCVRVKSNSRNEIRKKKKRKKKEGIGETVEDWRKRKRFLFLLFWFVVYLCIYFCLSLSLQVVVSLLRAESYYSCVHVICGTQTWLVMCTVWSTKGFSRICRQC